MELPLLALAPVIPPVFVPNVHANVLVVLADNVILELVPEHIVVVGAYNKLGVFILTKTQFDVSAYGAALEILLHNLY